MSAMRLASVSTRGVPGLPDVEVALQPVTALIGPRASGKSSMLRAISWLLSGLPAQLGESAAPPVSAQLVTLDGAAARTVERSQTAFPAPPLPPVVFLATRDRLPALVDVPPHYGSDAAAAEQMVAAIAERRLSGVEGELLLIEEPELMLTVHQQRHFFNLLHRYAERNQVVYSTRSPAMTRRSQRLAPLLQHRARQDPTDLPQDRRPDRRPGQQGQRGLSDAG